MRSDDSLKADVIKLIGNEAYQNNELNRKFVAKKIFNDSTLLTAFNAIVHPAVRRDFETWKQTNNTYPYLIKEAAILVESGAYKTVNKILVVTAPEAIRIERVCKRDKVSIAAVKARISKQMPEKELKTYADFLIDNSGQNLILPQVIAINEHLGSILK